MKQHIQRDGTTIPACGARRPAFLSEDQAHKSLRDSGNPLLCKRCAKLVGLDNYQSTMNAMKPYHVLAPRYRAVVEYGSVRWESRGVLDRGLAEFALQQELDSARALGMKPLRYGVQKAEKANKLGLLWGPLEA